MEAWRERRQGGGKVVALVVLAVLLLTLGGAIAWLMLGGELPEEVVGRFMTAFAAGDEPGMKACLSKASLELVDSGKVPVKGLLGSLPIDAAATEVGEASIVDDKAEVRVSLKLTQELPAGLSLPPIPYVLIKEEGQWKIDLQESSKALLGGGIGGGLLP